MRLGRYETLRPIASGGMATVHLARVVGAGGFERLVAIKVMHPHIAAEPEFVSMFLDEARLAARVRHPNVVPTIDVQEDPLFLVMEYIEGPSLHTVARELKKTSQRMPIAIALRALLDVFSGLHAAHELTGPDGEDLHLVHRDVSPHNILLGADGVARITDFGVARAASRLSSTQGGQVKGKLAYMAPEQVRSEPIDRRIDVYAAGVVLWETLTGQPLFKADNDAALMSQIAGGVIRPPSSAEPSIPAAIDAVCMRALANRQQDRFPTLAELADALEHAATSSGITPASPRALAKFVKELAVHQLASTASASGSGKSALPRGNGAIPAATPSGRELEPPSSGSGTGGGVPNSVTVATMAAPIEGMPTSRRRWPLAAALAVGALGIAALAIVATRDSDSSGSASSAAPSANSPTSAPTSPATTAPTEVAAPSPDTSAGASSGAVASASVSAPPPALTGRRPTGGTTARPPPTSFRPGGL